MFNLFHKKIRVSGNWTQRLWNTSYITQPLKMDAKPDIDAFFSQKKFPYLWPKDKAYVQWVDSKSDLQHFLKIQWAIAYAYHPDPPVLIKLVNALPKLVPKAPVEVILEHASLLTHQDDKVRAEAARTIGKYDDVVAVLNERPGKFCYMIPGPILEHKIKALVAIGNKEADKALGEILSRHLSVERKAEPISELKKRLNHFKDPKWISNVSRGVSRVMSTLADFEKSIFGYGWGEGGVGKSDEPWKEEVYNSFLKADLAVIKPELERLVSLLCRYPNNIERNPIAKLLDRLKPDEFIPLIRDYKGVIEGVVEFIEKHKTGILRGLEDELREAESGNDVKYVRDCQSQIKSLFLWKNCISSLESWLRYWEN